MKKLSKIILFMLVSLTSAMAQTPQPVEMGDIMRSEGKIYVVVAIMLVVFLGLIVYLVAIDRKVGKLEKKTGSKNA